MRPLLPMLLLLSGCAATPRAGSQDAPCEQHDDCGGNLLCEEATKTCQRDECQTADTCTAARLGEGRCETVDGVLFASTCAYDGDRCLEWSPEACDAGLTCEVGEAGAVCVEPPAATQ